MKITRSIIIYLSSFVLFLSNLSFGQTLFPFIGEKLSKYNTEYEISYTADFLGSKQGIETGSYFHDNINLVFDTDLDKLISWSGANLHLYVLGNNGDLINDHLGTIQWVNNISAVNTIKLYEVYFTQSLMNDKLSLLLGFMDLNSEFDVTETAGLFLNPSHGIGADFSQTGLNGPSIFPTAAMALRIEYNLNNSSLLRLGFFDAVAGDLQNPKYSLPKINFDNGLLITGEYNFNSENNSLRIGLGGWLYTDEYEEIKQSNPNVVSKSRGNYGIYSIIEKKVYSNNNSDVDMFIRAGYANKNYNPINYYLGYGINASNLFRGNDILGVAFAYAHVNPEIKTTGTLNYELNIELTYLTTIFSWLDVQPDIQYVINTGAIEGTPNTLVFGVRTVVNF